VLPDFHLSLNHDKGNLADFPGLKTVKSMWINVCSKFWYKCTEQCILDFPAPN